MTMPSSSGIPAVAFLKASCASATLSKRMLIWLVATGPYFSTSSFNVSAMSRWLAMVAIARAALMPSLSGKTLGSMQ
ncbi:unannotated protein [freshwater metagenome]|uniref:Unannotated protein n=1 Tax=freshwater metagenome TaxID=449393 RepID=A0A6J7KQT7_9ZZZZ